MTKLEQKSHNVLFSEESRFYVQYSVVSGGSEETSRRQLAFSIGTRALAPDMIVSTAIGNTTRTSLVRIDGNLNADRYIFDTFSPMVVPYLRRLGNAIFQQDNVRSHVVGGLLTFLDTQDVRLLNLPARSRDLSLIENI